VKRMLNFVSLLVAVSVASAVPASATNQPYFQGFWRCANGQTLNITPGFGPWLSYKSTQGVSTAQTYIYHDTSGGGWVQVGVNSSAAYWTMTSPGWQGNTLTYTGTYTNSGRAHAQRQVITKNSNSAMTVQTWRDGSLAGQVGCNK
jgi:hypothetical protein